MCEEYAMKHLHESGLLSQTNVECSSIREPINGSSMKETLDHHSSVSNFTNGNTHVAPLLSPSSKTFLGSMSLLSNLTENTVVCWGEAKNALICQTQ